MNERIEELRKQVDVDMHLHNLEDFRAMSGCFGLEGGNKIVDDYLDKFAELIVQECADIVEQAKKSPFVSLDDAKRMSHFVDVTKKKIKQHFGVEE